MKLRLLCEPVLSWQHLGTEPTIAELSGLIWVPSDFFCSAFTSFSHLCSVDLRHLPGPRGSHAVRGPVLAPESRGPLLLAPWAAAAAGWAGDCEPGAWVFLFFLSPLPSWESTPVSPYFVLPPLLAQAPLQAHILCTQCCPNISLFSRQEIRTHFLEPFRKSSRVIMAYYLMARVYLGFHYFHCPLETRKNISPATMSVLFTLTTSTRTWRVSLQTQIHGAALLPSTTLQANSISCSFKKSLSYFLFSLWSEHCAHNPFI